MKPILIADDDPADIALLTRLFQKARIVNPVQVVNDGKKAINYLQGIEEFADQERHPFPALFLLDLKMPMPGTAVLQWLRSNPTFRPPAVVVMTGSGNLAEIREAYHLGAHSFLMKPVLEEDLFNMVRYLKAIRTEDCSEGRLIEIANPGRPPTANRSPTPAGAGHQQVG